MRHGERVLVTCAMGRNRSGLISALAMRQAYKITGDHAIAAVRSARGPNALNNPQFCQVISDE